MEERTARVAIVDDQVSYAEAIGLALSLTPDLELVGRAHDRESALDLCLKTKPDLVISDYRLPAGQTGSMVAKALRDSGYEKPIILLTGFLAPQVVREAAEIDQVDAISKDESITEIIQLVRSRVFDTEPNADPRLEASAMVTLSPGELEVLELLNTGMTPAEIAAQLFLSLHTVRDRIKTMHRKLGVASQVEAIATATRLGLLVPPT